MNERQHRIVVGVDNSGGAREAVRWAARQAALTGAELQLVSAWEYPVSYGWAAYPIDVDLSSTVEEGTAALARQVLGEQHRVRYSVQVVLGPAAEVLLDAAVGADLLVVGSRGRGGFTGLLLGSVSQHCVEHAVCPVVVVPSAE